MSTPSRSPARRASASGRTLKPMMIASEAEASITSDSLMPPVWEWMMLIATRSCGTLAISSWSASREPATSALRTMLSSLMSPSWARAKTSSRLTLRAWRRARASVLSRLARSWASWRARRSFSTACTNSPASETPSKPSTSTGMPGAGGLDAGAGEVVHRPDPAPLRAGDQRVADLLACRAGPGRSRPGRGPGRAGTRSRCPSRRIGVGAELLELGHQQDHVEQVVEAFVGLGRDLAEDGVAPHSSGVMPSWASSVRTRSGWAPSLSILLTAISIGTSAARAWSIASLVCGMTPSSAATTTTATSVTLAPRARIAVKAAWPGVSRKVIVFSS